MSEPRKILLIDDDRSVHEVLGAYLSLAGLRLVGADDGAEGLAAMARERPDLVLLDVGLPKLSGIDVCRALKTNPEPPRVLLVTGNAEVPGMEACGADGVIAKPFGPVELLELVRGELADAGVRAA